jgi:hypothetical protein
MPANNTRDLAGLDVGRAKLPAPQGSNLIYAC